MEAIQSHVSTENHQSGANVEMVAQAMRQIYCLKPIVGLRSVAKNDSQLYLIIS